MAKKKKAAAKARKPKKAAKSPRRRAVKKPVAKKRAAKKRIAKGKVKKPLGPEASMQKIGEVTHYFPHVNAAAVKLLKDGLKVGDEIYLKGHTSDFREKIESIQLDHVPIQEGRKGQEIGLLVRQRVRIGDSVYKA